MLTYVLLVILWSVAGLAAFRAIGSCTFGIINIVHIIAEGRYKMRVGEIRNPFKNPFKKDWKSGTGSSLGSAISSKLGR